MASSAAANVIFCKNSIFGEYCKEWSIGIYMGDSPLNIAPMEGMANPVLTARDVNDVYAEAVADPFMIRQHGKWYMFFEVIHHDSKHGDIGLATSYDGLKWKYEQIVLVEPFHLSYPCVFEWKKELYMIPETSWENSVRLYKSHNFPYDWTFEKTLISLPDVADATPFYYDDKWWMFTSVASHDVLRLFFCEDLTGEWQEHPCSPIIEGNCQIARPGGRVLILDGRIIRFAQNDYPTYGTALRAFEIFELSTTTYKEKESSESPLLSGTGSGWSRSGMHHADLHYIGPDQWIGCVDGFSRRLVAGFRF
ncbi:MAG: hypothetical protein JXM70_11015 [Pirellulales bacterium]|nr:hypothetical protein [Pirellulales bacterium]